MTSPSDPAAPPPPPPNEGDLPAEHVRRVLEWLPLPAGLAVAGTGEVLHVNAAFTRAFGYTVADVPTVEAWMRRAYDGSTRPRAAEAWRHVEAAGDPPGPRTYPITCKDGSRRVVEVSGKRLGRWSVATFVDVTERERAREALASAEERHRLALDAAGLGTWTADTTTGLVDLDERARGHFGVDRTPVPIDELNLTCHPDDRDALGAAIFSFVDPSGPGRGATEQRVVLPSGEVRWVVAHVLARFDGAGDERHCVGVIATTRDTTEARRAEQALRAAEEQFRAAQRMEAVGRLAGGVAHDFNNLLTVISSYATLALDEPAVDAALREELEQIQSACRSAEALTRQLLAFSRKQALTPSRLRLDDLVRGLEKMLSRLIGEDVVLDLAIAPGLSEILADRGQIEQVLMNLAVNARDAMPSGGRLGIALAEVEIDERASAASDVPPGAYVEIAVTDTGCGMDAETRSRVFEPFFTTKASGQGTGLGLSMVYGVVRQSGGAIHVESEPGRGSTFRVRFPRLEPEASVRRSTVPPARIGRGGELLLVVDDEAALRTVLRRVLSGAGYQVLCAADGDEALRVCEAEGDRVRLVLSDVVMPGMSGRDLANRLAAVRPELPVVFMSGYTDAELARHGVLERRFLRKPFSMPSLLSTVRAALDAE